MAKMTVRHECGHTSRVDVGDGPAHDKAERVFEATLRNCPQCCESEVAEEDFAVGQNARIEQRAKSSTKTSGTAAEARRNAKAELAYRSIVDEGGVRGHPSLESFRVTSGSQLGVFYHVSHDMVTDYLHCDCMAGIHEKNCCHKQAVRRRVDERRAQWQAAYERDMRAGGYGYNDTLNLMFGVQASSEY